MSSSKRPLKLDEAMALSGKDANNLYRRHVNPGLLSVYKILGIADMGIKRARGMDIEMWDGRVITDYTSGLGVLGLGHNHPEILAAERRYAEHEGIDILKMGIHPMQAALSHNIACAFPDPLEVSFFTTSGAEAVEAAIKLVTRAQGPDKPYFIRTDGCYHGKTHGAMSFTDSEKFADGFYTGIPKEQIISIPYGDIEATKRVIAEHTVAGQCNIAAMILEPVGGQDLVTPPDGYLQGVVAACSQAKILTIFDEIKVGMGRMGTLLSFESSGVVPDVVTVSKALGGGRRAIGAMVTSMALNKRAYGKKKDSALHSTTFNGIGSSCAVAIEALRIISEPSFLAEVRSKSSYFRAKLEELQAKYPSQIKGIRGRGLFLGVEFNFSDLLSRVKKMPNIPFVKEVEVVCIGSVMRSLYRDHNLLTTFSGSRPNVLHIIPPLIIEQTHIDRLTAALDSLLDRGLVVLLSKFVAGNISDRLSPRVSSNPEQPGLHT